jgi:hypothetical protein
MQVVRCRWQDAGREEGSSEPRHFLIALIGNVRANLSLAVLLFCCFAVHADFHPLQSISI